MTDCNHNSSERQSELERRLREAEEKISYYQGIAEESGRRRLREIDQLSRLIDERKRAEERNAKLEAQLLQTRKMEAIGMMAAGVAHDLNNVLAGIVGYPDLLLMQLPEESPLRKPILAMQNSGNKAAAIVQDLLALARKDVVEYQPTNLNYVIREYLRSPEYEKLMTFHPAVRMNANLDPSLFDISGSPVHLSKTIMNLVSNAAEAMPNGGDITIKTFNRFSESRFAGNDNPMEGDSIVVTVSDTGIGISPEDKEKIFDPFYTKKHLGRSGTGLGMTVVWGTVQNHKGTVEVESSPGKGTTVTLCFSATREKRTETDATLLINTLIGKGESIVVVDDMAEQRELASILLARLNYDVTPIASGERAVEYLKDNTADLVILDMIMDPGMDGLETYKRIIEIHPTQKAIIASGFSETYRVEEAQKLGVGQCLQKPYTLEQIGKAVKDELEKY
ncbi:MAG: ATP-binding protein [Syntrophobacteraceae bacterium]